MSIKKHVKRELSIFKKFAPLHPFGIKLSSIRKIEHKGKPDISCHLLNGTPMAFELSEIIDESLRRKLGRSITLKKELDIICRKFPNKKRQDFKQKFKNTSIQVIFKNSISEQKCKNAIPHFLEFLKEIRNVSKSIFYFNSNLKKRCSLRICHLDQNPHFGSMFRVKDAVLEKAISNIQINPSLLSSHEFYVPDTTFFSEHIVECIRNKFNSQYKVASRVELLVYYNLQPELPTKHWLGLWLPKIKEFVEGNIQDSIFDRVWVYSHTRNKIIYDCKKLKGCVVKARISC